MGNDWTPRSVRKNRDKLKQQLLDIVDRLLARPENARGPWELPTSDLEKSAMTTPDISIPGKALVEK